MDARTLLSKIIVLIYRCKLVGIDANDDLIRTVIESIDTKDQNYKFLGVNIIGKLKKFCLELINDEDPIVLETFLPQLKLLMDMDDSLYESVEEQIKQEHSEATNKRIITSNVKFLNNYFREKSALDILNRMTYDLKFNRGKIKNFGEYLQNSLSELEPFTLTMTSIKDPAMVNEVDFEAPESLDEVFNEVKNLNNNNSIYKLGWQATNRMLQGGIRRGEVVGVEALQHKYKTGFTLSMFCDIAKYNSPIMTQDEIEAGKKPLLLRISFEDNLTNNLQFMYQYLKASDGEVVKPKDLIDTPIQDMRQYVIDQLTKTGFSIKMMRIDPSQWTYNSVFNKILELEAQGYSVHVLMLDYLFMLPTTGCIQGPSGTDKRDMLRRVRNFCSARHCAFITPFQLSTEAKTLLRNGVPDHKFVEEISEKGYTADCKQVDQELDVEIYVHLFNHNKKKMLSIGRGKHRIPTVIPEEDKYFYMMFPDLNVPVLPDLGREDSSFSKLPSKAMLSNDKMLDELGL